MLEFIQMWKQVKEIVGENSTVLALIGLWVGKEAYHRAKQIKVDFIAMKTEVSEIRKHVEVLVDFLIDKEGEKISKRMRRKKVDTDEQENT